MCGSDILVPELVSQLQFWQFLAVVGQECPTHTGTSHWVSAYLIPWRFGMYCNYCGKSIQDDANVCAYCGTRVGGVIGRKRLVRPREGRKIAGVCLGVAEYFDLDVTVVRLVWLIVAVFTGIGLLSYPIAWIVMPDEPYLLQSQAPTSQQVTSA